MMVETRPVGCGLFRFWVVLVVLVLFSTIRLFFPSFNDDLGTMPTRRPYSWKKGKLHLLSLGLRCFWVALSITFLELPDRVAFYHAGPNYNLQLPLLHHCRVEGCWQG